MAASNDSSGTEKPMLRVLIFVDLLAFADPDFWLGAIIRCEANLRLILKC